MLPFLGLANLCPACWSQISWQQPHDCAAYRTVDTRREELTDDEVERIARRVAEILSSSKRAAEI